MAKYPSYIQDEEMSCGAYCILMILKYYGYQEEIKEIKKKTRLNQNGISIKGMIECLKEYQIESKAYEASIEDIQQNIKLPCILYMVYKDIGHFVVLYEIKDDEYIIGDPAQGLVTLYSEDIEEHYASRVIAIHHVGRVPDLTYKPYYLFLKDIFLSYRKQMIKLIKQGIWISLLSYLCSYFYQIFIDHIHQDTHLFYMIILCVTYGITEMIKVLIDYKRIKQMTYLQKAIDEDCVFQSSMNLFSLPYTFYYQDKGQIQSQLTSFYQLSQLSIEYFGQLLLDAFMFIIFVIGMFILQPLITLCVCAMFLLIFILGLNYLKKLQNMHKDYLESHFQYQHHLLELIENQFLIRRYSLTQKTRERSYDLFLNEAFSKEKQMIYINEFQHKIQYIIYIFYIMIMIIGFYFYHQNHITMGRLMMFYMLLSYCIQPLLNIISLLSEYKQTSLIYEKYKSFECEKDEQKDSINQPITSITLDNVSYSYGYQLPLFEHIDINIQNHFLLRGNTGSGKSTLLRLLMGYDMNYKGDIYINDQELRTISLKSLYQHIGYVCQSPTFLHISLFDNFLCDDANKVKKLLKAFHQEQLIDMFHLILDEEGQPLSLGQRQIVAVVRVLCQNYDVLIFDEAFSHMDSALASRVQRYLYQHDQGKIYIMVNHQTKTIRSGWQSLTLNQISP